MVLSSGRPPFLPNFLLVFLLVDARFIGTQSVVGLFHMELSSQAD